MTDKQRLLLSGNEAVALAALHAKVSLGVGYPGTPSTEILENLDRLGGVAQWSPNEKVALEVGIGVAFGGGRALVTMKHVGVNVAADPLFTVAYSGVPGGLVLVSADDPGMASSQNEQDNRYYARAAGVPMFEPADSQEAYEFTLAAFELAETYHTLVMLRLTTRVCHSQTVVVLAAQPAGMPPRVPGFERAVDKYVMVPAYARPAHLRMRARLAQIQAMSEASNLNAVYQGSKGGLGIITSGISYMHCREAAPDASIFKMGLSYPLPVNKLREFVATVDHCFVIEEGEPLVFLDLRAAGLVVENKPDMYRFGELNVGRVRRILVGDTSKEPIPPKGKPPALCQGCPHRQAFEVLRDLDCIVSGDIGCYTLGVMPPFNAIDTCVCMGASIGVGLGLRQVLPDEQARRVVSVIGDSTFVHSGLTGVAEMVYNPPPSGHVLLILDNATTAMTGLQEHPGTGRRLNQAATTAMDFEAVCRAMGVSNVQVLDPYKEQEKLRDALLVARQGNELQVIIMRRPCILAAKKQRRSAVEPAPAKE